MTSISPLAAFGQDANWQKLMDDGTAAYNQQNYKTAQDCFSSAVTASLNNKAHLAKALNDLGLVQLSQGNTAEAEKTFQQALATKTEAFGSDNIELVPTLNNLGKLIASYRGGMQQKNTIVKHYL